MLTRYGRASTRFILRLAPAVVLFGFLPGCALIPTWNDVSSAGTAVKDTMTGKAKRDRQTQTFAEARILERRKDYAGAEREYRKLIAELPGNRDCYHRLGVMAAVQGKFAEANEHYRQALAAGNPTADLWNDVGYCHYLQHQLVEAEQAYRQALAITPQHRSSLNNLALVMGEQGNLEEAYRLFKQANSEGEAEANFAYLCAQCGDLQRAQRHYSRALSSDPELRSALEGLFQVTQRLQRVQDATAPQTDSTAEAQNGVRLAGYNEAKQSRPRRMIEVYTGGGLPRSGESNSTPAAANAAAPPATNPASSTASPPAAAPGPPQPQAAGLMPHGMVETPQPYSFPQAAQPQYLQPQSQPGMAMQPSGGVAAPPGLPALNAGGPFPSLVGGASAVR